MEQVFLSDIDLFYSSKISEEQSKVFLDDEEFNHAVKVLRKNVYDEIFITDGIGKIYQCEIRFIEKKNLTAEISKKYSYNNRFSNLTFCLPLLKNKERQEFALEKSIELGITNFIYYSSDKSFKSKPNLERINKIALAAMKQSLQAFKPNISFVKSINDLKNDNSEIIYFDQKGEDYLESYLNTYSNDKNYVLIIGSESGFSDSEMNYLRDKTSLKLSNNRLRSETAVIYAAVIINSTIK
ncbi:MAG: hypothetical protein CMF23_09690 [Ignavibacteriae bacterium]|nr:hypothetical protein [Ignavibacteriota bacterium]